MLSVSAMSSPQFQLLRMLQYLELSRDVKGDGKREDIGEQYDSALHARFYTPGNCRSCFRFVNRDLLVELA
jgi:hypothetical protein